MKSILVATLWLTLLGCFTPSAHSETGGGGNSPPEYPLCFIRQNNSAVGGEFPCLRVSKMVTSLHLPATADYEGPVPTPPPPVPPNPGPVPDPDTYRVQISNHPSGQPYIIELVVKRQGEADRTFTFNTVEDGSTGNYRTTQHFRLVSNPADDDFGGDQTIMVQLEDTIKVIQKSGGAEIGTYELNVNRPHTEDGPDAIRTVDLVFHTFDVVGDNYPDTAVMFLNRNGAQAGIRYHKVSETNHGSYVQNTLLIGTGGAPGGGTISLKVDGTAASASYNQGDNGLQIAEKLAIAITAKGFTATHHINSGFPDTPGIVLVNKGTNVTFTDLDWTKHNHPTQLDVVFKTTPMYVPGGPVTETTCNVVGLNYKDNDDTTVDMFVFKGHNNKLEPLVLARCGGEFLRNFRPGMVNACFYPQVIVMDPPGPGPGMATGYHYANILGHELVHCLHNVGNSGHSADAWNIVYPNTDPGSPPLDGHATTNPKRLTEAQQAHIRSLTSGLLKKK